MNRTELLITGQSTIGLEIFIDRLHKHGDWSVITAAGDEEAIEKFHRYDFEVVVFTDTISSDEERKLRKIFTFHNPDIIIVKRQHDNEDVLVAEIITALEKFRKAKRPSYSLVDDALKNAGLNVIIE